MRINAVIQARAGSSRLPAKVLADLGGRPVLEWVVRAARAANLVDVVAILRARPDLVAINADVVQKPLEAG